MIGDQLHKLDLESQDRHSPAPAVARSPQLRHSRCAARSSQCRPRRRLFFSPSLILSSGVFFGP
ncbi:hypothetical protein L484_002601 [Morus notabilis]|uniref:Uncharacterized protein n=1 Tax=Morus notabilis TaxID=981085 RepID=W9S988_9ROSA|nr:hypothetical protein L484_002601 [Morus notabilis]